MPFDPLHRKSFSGLAFRPEITQGAILSGLKLPRYEVGSHFGFLITARCDLAHVRTDTVNFLPIISLDNWLSFDCPISIILSRLLNLEDELAGTFNSISPAIRDMVNQDWIKGYELFVRDDAGVQQALKDKLRSRVEEYAQLTDILENKSDSPTEIATAYAEISKFRELIDRSKQKKITALLENKILDAHFLPVLHPSEKLTNGPGYVVMFRQIISLPGKLLEILKRGVDSEDSVSLPLRAQASQAITFPAEIISNIKSPYVEFILQRFAHVFGRIGVSDCSEQYKKWLLNTHSEG